MACYNQQAIFSAKRLEAEVKRLERMVFVMSIKKTVFVFFMIVMIVMAGGCASDKDGNRASDKVVDVTETTADTFISVYEDASTTQVSEEEPVTEEDNAEVIMETATEVSTEAPAEIMPTESMHSEEDTLSSTEAPKPTEAEPTVSQPMEPGSIKSDTTEPIIYDPYQVVNLVIAKCQAGGMITTEDNLENLLAEGKITQAEYDEYYPLDGLEGSYYSVFVAADLNIASDIVGNKLGSVDGIADYIAGMLLLETQPVFNVTYAGVYTLNGVDFYEFRCHR